MRGSLVLLLLVTSFLAGCSDSDGLRGESVTLTQAQVLPNSDGVRNIQCGEKGRIEVTGGTPDDGDITVTVRDGQAIPIFSKRLPTDEAMPFEKDLKSFAGTWTLIVDRTMDHNTPFTVTLHC